jgi:hypothetical protein
VLTAGLFHRIASRSSIVQCTVVRLYIPSKSPGRHDGVGLQAGAHVRNRRQEAGDWGLGTGDWGLGTGG